MRFTRRDAVAILLIALICGLATALPPMRFVHGWSIDILTALRWELYGPRQLTPQPPAVVIAIDEETHETPPFDNSPTATWTPEIGRVLTAVLDGGAKVAGFAIVFAETIWRTQVPLVV